ncbi:MAG: hypothetical protein QOF68_1246, partial [Gaiellales bacterium]|nr:hypothetical protein [Gaiellales bacterium]
MIEHTSPHEAPSAADRAEIVRLAALSTGDEKHEASSYST